MKKKKIRRLDERMNEKIESLPEHHGNSADLSYLVFYSYPLTSFFKIKKKKYRPIFIFWPESGIFPSMVIQSSMSQYLEW